MGAQILSIHKDRVGALLFGLCAFLLFIFYFTHISSSGPEIKRRLAEIQRQLPAAFSGSNPHSWRGDFASYLAANEKARAAFLAKRKRIEKPENESQLWYPKGGLSPYVWHYYPPDFTCPHVTERVGTVTDGGKWMCGLHLFEDSKEPCIVYSIGVGGDSSFEQEILDRTACSIFAFDHTRESMPLASKPEYSGRVTFIKKGLSGTGTAAANGNFTTFPAIMAQLGHEWIDFLKVDAEGSEFDGMFEAFSETFPFGHLNIEIHLEHREDEALSKASFTKMSKLWGLLESKGMRAFAWEDNHYACIIQSYKPYLMEYGFMNVMDGRNKLIQF